ncbi:hypothetical protein DPMN_031033 [Dreissena polymorpha]|uniref:Uncharacterized protein n=1 Tax=Dreissena polymorpha TaxID=45954 RepID=A0A9D4M3T0_DREPO|nr:hypothetical protein DPMN_031033 [Dreissena polymorpha]
MDRQCERAYVNPVHEPLTAAHNRPCWQRISVASSLISPNARIGQWNYDVYDADDDDDDDYDKHLLAHKNPSRRQSNDKRTALLGTLEGGRYRGRQKKSWIDDQKELTSLPLRYYKCLRRLLHISCIDHNINEYGSTCWPIIASPGDHQTTEAGLDGTRHQAQCAS